MASACHAFSKSVPRGSKTFDLSRQSETLAGTGKWIKEMGEDGEMQDVYCCEKKVLGLPTQDGDIATRDPSGLVISRSSGCRTLYDLIFKPEYSQQFDTRPACGHCVKPHTFKDEKNPDGTANPKPTLMATPGIWEFCSYKQLKRDARAFGSCLRNDYKIGEKEKIAIWSGNCPEWLVCDLACSVYNWSSVSVYDSLGPNAASYIAADSGAKVLVCEDRVFKQVPKLLDEELYKSNPGKDLMLVVFIGKGDPQTAEKLIEKGVKVLSFKEAVSNHIANVSMAHDTPPTPNDIATIMYTSGTTGVPKGVMLTHVNLLATISAIAVNPSFQLMASDVHLSYLPLAHIFERENILCLLSVGAVVYFASNGAKGLMSDLSVVKPTIFVGVPKVYENVRAAVLRKMTGWKKTLFERAMSAKTNDLETGCGYSPIWDMLFFDKTKKALGGRVRFCVSGGAPISRDTLQFVTCALAPAVQGYGATETSSASTLTMSFDLEMGHVGAPIGTSMIQLVDVPDMNYYNAARSQYSSKAQGVFAQGRNKSGGEVWIGGPAVSPGYYDPGVHGVKPNIPSNGMGKKNKEEFFHSDGWSWFKTGDIGTWTERGCLKIVDRRKNIFKTSLGEYVPVDEVEKVYQDFCSWADFVYVPKETKVAYVALCVIVSDSFGLLKQWAKDNGVEGNEEAIVSSAKVKGELFAQLEKAAKAKSLQRFLWIPSVKNVHLEYQPTGYQERWVTGVRCANGQEEQLLTATFKARRDQLNQYFAPHFPKIYPDRPADHTLP